MADRRVPPVAPNTTYADVTGHIVDGVTTDEEGWAAFQCLGQSVSVWLPA